MVKKPVRVIRVEPVSYWHTQKGQAGYRQIMSRFQENILKQRDLELNLQQREFVQRARAKRTKKIYLSNRQEIYTRYVSDLEKKILAKVQSLGIPVEEKYSEPFTGYKVPKGLEDRFLFFKSAGISLAELVESRSPLLSKAMAQVKEKMPLYLAKLHNAGIRHGHLHLGNIVYDPQKKEIRIIDFSGAKDFGDVTTYISGSVGPQKIYTMPKKWENIDELLKIMYQDYYNIMQTLEYFSDEEFKEFWGKVYDLYDLKYKSEKDKTRFVYKMIYIRHKACR